MARIFIINNDALSNYGQQWKNVRLVATHAATRYMPAEEFFAKGKPEGYHPGYDGAAGSTLYDLKREVTGEDLKFSLYRWELTEIG